MNKETLDHLELLIFAEQTHDVNFQNIAKELFKEICFQNKEIERLNKDLDTSIEICNKRQEEIVRLNNIINELEKYLHFRANKLKEHIIRNGKGFIGKYSLKDLMDNRINDFEDALNKLAELKEGK